MAENAHASGVATARPSVSTPQPVVPTSKLHVALLPRGNPAPSAANVTAVGSRAIAVSAGEKKIHQTGTPSTTTTTNRVDKTRMSAAERAAREERRRQETEQWRKQYWRGFPKFVFYLDGFEGRSGDQIAQTILGCGGQIEQFFSKNCTHVVTSRKNFDASRKAVTAVSAPQAPTAKTSASNLANVIRKPITKRFSPSKKNFLRRNKDTPLHSDRNPFEDAAPAPRPQATAGSGNDVVSKALEYKMRVWNTEKFWSTMSTLLGQDLNDDTTRSRQDLAQMLRNEKIHGTSERDVTAPRDDMYYFDKRSIYIFVGDATQEHRPIMNFEFDQSKLDLENPPWPKLYGEEEGRCPFTKMDPERRRRRQQRRLAMEEQAAERARQEHEMREQQLNAHREKTYRRSVSHSTVALLQSATPDPCPTPTEDRFREASPYALASGNSVSCASHMTSMATTGSQAMTRGGGAGLAPQDRRVTQLTRRVVSPAPAAHGLDFQVQGPSTISRLQVESSHQQPRAHSEVPVAVPAPSIGPSEAPAPKPRSRVVSGADAHAARVRDSLGMSNHPIGASERMLSRSASVETGTALAQMQQNIKDAQERLCRNATGAEQQQQQQQQHQQREAQAQQEALAQAQLKAQEKKPFCENCKESFSNFDKHVNSERHRKFALTEENFVSVDELIARIARPVAPWTAMPEYRHLLQEEEAEEASSDEEEFDDDECEEEDEEGYHASLAAYLEGNGEDGADDDSLSEGEAVEDADEGELAEGEDDATDRYVDYDGLQDAFVTYDGQEIVMASSHRDGAVDVSGEYHPGEQSYETNTSYEEDEDHTTPHTSPEAQPLRRGKNSPAYLHLEDQRSSRANSIA